MARFLNDQTIKLTVWKVINVTCDLKLITCNLLKSPILCSTDWRRLQWRWFLLSVSWFYTWCCLAFAYEPTNTTRRSWEPCISMRTRLLASLRGKRGGEEGIRGKWVAICKVPKVMTPESRSSDLPPAPPPPPPSPPKKIARNSYPQKVVTL